MRTITNTGSQTIELAPGAILRVTAIGAGSYANLSLTKAGGNSAFLPVSTFSNEAGIASAGPFTTVMNIQLEVRGSAGIAVYGPDALTRDPITGIFMVAGATANLGTGSSIAWIANTAYAAGDRALAPNGRLVVAYSAHVSGTFFDAEKWVFPTDDGSTVFDFSQLPDGNLETVYPTKGHLYSRSLTQANWDKLVVLNGRLQMPGTAVNFYFEAGLADSRYPVQHMWCIADCVSDPDNNNGMTFLFPERDQSLGISAGIHSGVLPRINTDYTGTWKTEAYPQNLGGIRVSPTYNFTQQPRGRSIRFDLTVDASNGLCTGFVDGLVAWQYRDIDIISHIRHTGMIQFPTRNFKVKEFGISPTLPNFAFDGSARHPQAKISGWSSVLGTALTTEFQKVWEFPVCYDAGGAVEITMPMLLLCTAGYIEFEHGTSTVAADQSAAYVTKVIGAGMEAMVHYSGVRTGIPGTTETVGLWARVTSGGAGQIRSDTYGNNCRGPRWRPMTYAQAIGVGT